MSDIKFDCPQCGIHLVVDEAGAGMSVACPGCGRAIVIPSVRIEPPTPAAHRHAGKKSWFRIACAVVCVLAGGGLLWFLLDGRLADSISADRFLRSYFGGKQEQAKQLAEKLNLTIPSEVWEYFDAAAKGEWTKVTNLWNGFFRGPVRDGGSRLDPALHTPVWQCVMETAMARNIFDAWGAKYAVKFGRDIIQSIPPGSIYLGGTDQGRGLVTALCESHADGRPFFTLTQNALGDESYLEYLRAMYGDKIYVPTREDVQTAFENYVNDAVKRLRENRLLPGEDVRVVGGRVEVAGQVAVMAINGQLAKIMFDKNPGREFFLEESFPLEWTYPHLSPHGLILKINRTALETISPEQVRQDQGFWEREVAEKIGDWLREDTSVPMVCDFIQKVVVNRDYTNFTGDRDFVGRRDMPYDYYARAAYAKLRCAIAGVYAWRAAHAKAAEEKQRMARAADYAFRQAVALDPGLFEPVFRYVSFLAGMDRLDEGLLLAKTCRQVARDDTASTLDALISSLEKR